MAPRGLTSKAVENLRARDRRYEIPDPGCAGLYLQVHPSGAKSWAYRYRFTGKSRKLTIGAAYTEAGVEVIKIGDARDVADEARVLVAKRIDPIEVEKKKRKAAAPEKLFRNAAELYFKENKKLRTVGQREKAFERLVYPVFGGRELESIKRSEITSLLDGIAEQRGPVMADYVLAMLRRLLLWHAARSDDYNSPIIRGMSRTSTTETARSRVLSKIEIRAFWNAADEADLFGRYLQFVFLTAARRNEAAHVRRSEVQGSEWIVPASRYKTKIDHLVPMPDVAVALLGNVPRFSRCDFIFTADGEKPIAGFGCRKESFDALMLKHLQRLVAEEGGDADAVRLERWTLHDLRRTARTLMSELKIPSEHAEACLGHVKKGVEGTYDRYQYRDEKKEAFAKLAEFIDRMVNPGSNVVAFAESA